MINHISGTYFLVDTGAEVSVLPFPIKPDCNAQFGLKATKGSPIATFERQSETLDLGLRREFRWVFIIASVPFAILGIDFFRHFDLLVDTRRFQLIDNTTKLSV